MYISNLKNERCFLLWTILLLIPLSVLVVVNQLVFNLIVEQYYPFLPPNVTSAVQPLDQEIIASFKVWNKKKLLEWVLSQFDSSNTHGPRLEENNA